MTIIKITVGLAFLLGGMSLFVNGLKPLAELQIIKSVLNPLVMFGLALLGTLLWQSSSITTAILVGLVGSGVIPLEVGISGVLGANIGTTGTALLASITAGKAGLQLAIFHGIFNISAALIALPFVGWIAEVIKSWT